MMTRLTHYFSALIFLVAMAVVYQNTFVPWIEPEEVAAIAIKPAQSLRVDDTLKDLFPEGAWQRGACKCLQTADGMLLFENWEQTSGDRWKLWPITVVIGRGMSNNRSVDPMILEATEGAEISFSDSLDVMSGGAPPIERGRLIGPVHIFRQVSSEGGSATGKTEFGKTGSAPNVAAKPHRKIDLRTSNVGIDKRKLWTTDAIEMQVGSARMVGRDLTLHFAGDPTQAGNDPRSVLDRMELIYLDELTLPLDTASARPAVASDPRDPKGVVTIGCQGRVEYDFALDLLMMRDSVSLVHQSPQGVVDRFDCHRLQLWLNDPTNDLIQRKGPLDWMHKLVAVGDASESKPATAVLPTFDASLTADEILVDARSGKVRASGEHGIRLERGPIWAGLSDLEYDFDPRHPEVMGTLKVNGAGVVKISDPHIAVRKTQWRTKLQVKPRGMPSIRKINTDIDIHVEGDFHAWMIDGGEFQADSIHARMTPDETSSEAPGETLGETPSLVPREVNVTGHVVINTSALVAETDFLRLLFLPEADPVVKDDAGKPVAKSPLRQWVSQPSSEEPMQVAGQVSGAQVQGTQVQGTQVPGIQVPPARTRPVLKGSSIQAVLRQNAAGLSVKSLQVEGNVQVTHTLETAQANMPIHLSADKLRLLDGAGDDVLELTSSPENPARFDIGDGFFIGRTIQVRPTENMIWIPHAGEFQIPTGILPTGIAGDNDADGIKWTRPPYCRWQGEMTFDGHTVVLSEGVDITASLLNNREPWDFQMEGDQLKVKLWEDVSLSDVGSMRGAKLQSISLLQSGSRPVMVHAMQRAPDGVLAAKHLLHASELTFLPTAQGKATRGKTTQKKAGPGKTTQGKLVGSGPGWYRGWMPSQSSGFMKSNAMKMDSHASMVDDASKPLTGIHLTFNDAMQVDLNTHNLSFSRGVRVGMRPVSHWDEVFHADQLDSLAAGETTLDCEQLQVTLEPSAPNQPRMRSASRRSSQPTPWEVQAVAGIVLRTRSQRGLLEVTASRASYAASKDLFTLRGAPGRPAIIKQSLPNGKPRFDAAVQTAVIRPRSMTIESMEVDAVNMATPAGLAQPKPGSYR